MRMTATYLTAPLRTAYTATSVSANCHVTACEMLAKKLNGPNMANDENDENDLSREWSNELRARCEMFGME